MKFNSDHQLTKDEFTLISIIGDKKVSIARGRFVMVDDLTLTAYLWATLLPHQAEAYAISDWWLEHREELMQELITAKFINEGDLYFATQQIASTGSLLDDFVPPLVLVKNKSKAEEKSMTNDILPDHEIIRELLQHADHSLVDKHPEGSLAREVGESTRKQAHRLLDRLKKKPTRHVNRAEQ